jgi:hypothetical protein
MCYEIELLINYFSISKTIKTSWPRPGASIAPTHLIAFFKHAAGNKEFYQTMLNIYHSDIFKKMLNTYLVVRSTYRLQSGALRGKKPEIPYSISRTPILISENFRISMKNVN